MAHASVKTEEKENKCGGKKLWQMGKKWGDITRKSNLSFFREKVKTHSNISKYGKATKWLS